MAKPFADPPSLVLFSGGKDSFLTACREIEGGYSVKLFSCNGGYMAGEENLQHGAQRLVNRYTSTRVEYIGVYPTVGVLQRINKAWVYQTAQELSVKYPTLKNVQSLCLNCQTAMWISAIAYAKAKDIKRIAAGYRQTDEFCTGSSGFLARMSTFAQRQGMETAFPVWDETNWTIAPNLRDEEMISRQFEPQVLEPKCLMGRPTSKFTQEEERDLMRYFDDNLEPHFQECVDILVPIFQSIRLSPKALEPLHYPTPTAEGGIY